MTQSEIPGRYENLSSIGISFEERPEPSIVPDGSGWKDGMLYLPSGWTERFDIWRYMGDPEYREWVKRAPMEGAAPEHQEVVVETISATTFDPPIMFEEANSRKKSRFAPEIIEAEQRDADRHGYEEARDMMPCDPRTTYQPYQRTAYLEGYRRGVMEKVDEGTMTINQAREKLGTIQPEMVNMVAHYGGDDVAQFIDRHGLDFFLGNVVKYVARAGKKSKDKLVEDLSKARWYLNFKIVKLGGEDWNPKNK